MRSTYTGLLCVALLSASAFAQANGGTIRFSGRVAEPGCTTNLSSGVLSVTACPPSAKGSTVEVFTMDNGEAITLQAGRRYGRQLTMSGSRLRTGDLTFSEDYRVEASQREGQRPPLRGGYSVLINYL